MRIRVTERYFDRELDMYKNPEEEMDVEPERAQKLIGMQLAEAMKEEEDEKHAEKAVKPVEEAVKPAAPKRSTAKKTTK